MKLKLTAQQFAALYNIVSAVGHKYQCADMWDKLLYVSITSLYMKLYKMAVIKKPKYTIRLTDQEAISFFIMYEDHNLPAASFEGNLITSITSSIHEKFIV